jgi:hypothetical protein
VATKEDIAAGQRVCITHPTSESLNNKQMARSLVRNASVR